MPGSFSKAITNGWRMILLKKDEETNLIYRKGQVMKKTLCAVMIFAVSLCLALPAQAFEFSADIASSMRGSSMSGKAYVSPKGTRMEVAGMGGTITRIDKKVVWVLMDRERMYMEQPFDPKMAASVSEKAEGEVERTLIGGEKISGSDIKESRITGELTRLGAQIFLEHNAANIQGADLVIYSSAIKEDTLKTILSRLKVQVSNTRR